MPRKSEDARDAAHSFTSLVERTGQLPFARTRDATSVGMQLGRFPLDSDSDEQDTIDGRPARLERV
jgi:hypothetical protein